MSDMHVSRSCPDSHPEPRFGRMTLDRAAAEWAVPQEIAAPATLTAQQKVQPVMAILALHAILIGANASFTLRPNADRRLGPILLGCMLGLVFGVTMLPAVARWNRRAKTVAIFPYGILLRAPLFLLCLNYLPVFLLGYDTWLQDNTLRHISNFALFATLPLVYHVYYSRLPVGSRGMWLGIAVVFELIVWRAVAEIALRMGAVVPGTTHPMLPYVFWGLMACMGWLTAILLYNLVFRGGQEALPAPRVSFPEMEEKPARGRIALVVAAAVCMYAMSGVADVKQAPALTLLAFPTGLEGLRLFALALIPLAGWWLDMNPLPAFRVVCLLCGSIFIFAPIISILRDTPEVLWGIVTLVEVAHYVAILAFNMALGGVVRREDGIRRWPAILIFTRSAMEICFWLFRIRLAIPTGLAVLLGMVFAFAFLVLTYLLARPPRGSTEQDAGTDLAAFLASRDLTGRQREVAELVLRGQSTREIAEALAIAEPTVKIHVRKTLEKFDCPTRKAFVAKWLEEIGGAGRDSRCL